MKKDAIEAIFPYLDRYDREIIDRLARKGLSTYYALAEKHKAGSRTAVFRHLFYELSGRPNLTSGGFVKARRVRSRGGKKVWRLSLTLKGELVAYLLGWEGFLDRYGGKYPWEGKMAMAGWLKLLKAAWILPRLHTSGSERNQWDRVKIWDMDFLYNLAFEGFVRLLLHKHLTHGLFIGFMSSPIPMPQLFEEVFDDAKLNIRERDAVLKHLEKRGWARILNDDVREIEGWMSFRLSEGFQEPFPRRYFVGMGEGKPMLEPKSGKVHNDSSRKKASHSA